MEPSYKGVGNFFEKLLNPAFTDQERFKDSSKTKWTWLSIGTGLVTFGIAHAIYHGGKGIAKGGQALYDWGSKKMKQVETEKGSPTDKKTNKVAMGGSDKSRGKGLGIEKFLEELPAPPSSTARGKGQGIEKFLEGLPDPPRSARGEGLGIEKFLEGLPDPPLISARQQNLHEANEEYLNKLKKDGMEKGIEVREIENGRIPMSQKPEGVNIIVYAIRPSPTERIMHLATLETDYEIHYFKEGEKTPVTLSDITNLKASIHDARKEIEASKQDGKRLTVQEQNRKYIENGAAPEKGIFAAGNFAEATEKLHGPGAMFKDPCAIYVDPRNPTQVVLLEKGQNPRLVMGLIEEEVNKIPRGILSQEPSPNEAFFEKAKGEGRGIALRDGGSYERRIEDLARKSNKSGAYIVDIRDEGFRCRLYLDKKSFVDFDVKRSEDLEQAIKNKTVESERLYQEFNEHFEGSDLHHVGNYQEATKFVKDNPGQCCIYKSSRNSAFVNFCGPNGFEKKIGLGENLQEKIKQYQMEAQQSATKSPVEESVEPSETEKANQAFIEDAKKDRRFFSIREPGAFETGLSQVRKPMPGRVFIAEVGKNSYYCRHYIEKGIYQDFELKKDEPLEQAIAKKMKQNTERYAQWNSRFESYKKLKNDNFAVVENMQAANKWLEKKESQAACCIYKSTKEPGVIRFYFNNGTDQKDITFNGGDDLTEKIEEYRALARESALPSEKAGGHYLYEMAAMDEAMEMNTAQAEKLLITSKIGDYIVHKSTDKTGVVITIKERNRSAAEYGIANYKFKKYGDGDRYSSNGTVFYTLTEIREIAEKRSLKLTEDL